MDIVIVQALEHIRCGFLNVFFGIFTALGEEFIIAGIIAVVFLCFDKRAGERALVAVLIASCFTTGIKSAVRRMRPYTTGLVSRVDIDLPLISTTSLDADMSFPSGHSTSSGAFFSTLALNHRTPLRITLCAVFTFLVVLSRLYLGVHYPTDVLAGLAIGIGCAFLWEYVCYRMFFGRLYVFLGIALLTLPLLFIPQTATESMFRISALALAAAFGLLIEDNFIRFTDTKRWWKRGLRLAVAGIVALVVFLPLKLWLPEGNWSDFLTYFLTVFAVFTFATFLIRVLKI